MFGGIVKSVCKAVGLGDEFSSWIGFAANIAAGFCTGGATWVAAANDACQMVARYTDSEFFDNVAMGAGLASAAYGGITAGGSLMDAGRFTELARNVGAAKSAYDAAGAANAIGDVADATHQTAQMWQYAGEALNMVGGYARDFQRAQSHFNNAQYRAQMMGI